MDNRDLEELIKKKRLEYSFENDEYIFDHFRLKNRGNITYYSSTEVKDVELQDDWISGILNMKWGECQYAKAFAVLGFIHPGRHDDAYNYLYEDNMTQYFDNEDPLGIITDMRWELTKPQSGLIICTCNASWPKWYFGPMASYCDGQNSDGLGESFEQQNFISMRKNYRTIVSDESNWFKY